MLTFLDAHIECTDGWLQPLLARIASDRSVVAVPFIDFIQAKDMKYNRFQTVYINGFIWKLTFDWY